jgi:hypothetical protein
VVVRAEDKNTPLVALATLLSVKVQSNIITIIL